MIIYRKVNLLRIKDRSLDTLLLSIYPINDSDISAFSGQNLKSIHILFYQPIILHRFQYILPSYHKAPDRSSQTAAQELYAAEDCRLYLINGKINKTKHQILLIFALSMRNTLDIQPRAMRVRPEKAMPMGMKNSF